MWVEHFGFYSDGNLVFLVEDGEPRCLTPGLEGLPSPFKIRRRGKDSLCPHRLHDPNPGQIVDHPLARAMAPIPAESGGKAFWLPRSELGTLIPMLRMIGNHEDLVHIPWDIKNLRERTTFRLTLTNAAPLIISEYEPRHFTILQRLLTMHRTRNLILCGPYRLAGCEEIQKYDGPLDLDWASVGAAFTYEYVRTQAENA